MVRACRLVDDTPHALPRLWELYRIIVTGRQQSAHSFSALRSLEGAGQGNLRSHDESTDGLCARRICGSACP